MQRTSAGAVRLRILCSFEFGRGLRPNSIPNTQSLVAFGIDVFASRNCDAVESSWGYAHSPRNERNIKLAILMQYQATRASDGRTELIRLGVWA